MTRSNNLLFDAGLVFMAILLLFWYGHSLAGMFHALAEGLRAVA